MEFKLNQVQRQALFNLNLHPEIYIFGVALFLKALVIERRQAKPGYIWRPAGKASTHTAECWDGLCVLLSDDRIAIACNIVERTIRPIALNRNSVRTCPGVGFQDNPHRGVLDVASAGLQGS